MRFGPNTRKNQYLEIWDIYQKYLPNNDKLYGQTLFAKFFPNIIWKIYGQTGPISKMVCLSDQVTCPCRCTLKTPFI